jgi:hypothetical protein
VGVRFPSPAPISNDLPGVLSQPECTDSSSKGDVVVLTACPLAFPAGHCHTGLTP